MVDTINPTPNNDSTGNQNHFYSGFNRPDEVNVNLAAKHKEAESQVNSSQAGQKAPEIPVIPPAYTPPEPNPNAPSATPFAQVAPSEETQPISKPSYQTAPTRDLGSLSSSPQKEPIAWSKVLLVLTGLVAVIVICGLASYFISGYIGNNDLNQKRDNLSSLNKKLDQLNQAPAPLELPETIAAPPESTVPTEEVETAPVVTPPVEEPVVPTPAPSQPEAQPNGGQDAQG